jgi:putative membrane protein
MKLIALFLALSLFGGVVQAQEGLQDQTKPQVATPDESFLNEARRRAETEIRSGELATTQAGSDKVKALGDRLMVGHATMNEELKGIARQKAVNLWGDPDNIRLSELRQLSGAAFDRAYLADVVRRHERAIADFDQALRASSDPEVKAFIAKYLPALRTHLAAVKQLSTPEAVAPVRAAVQP